MYKRKISWKDIDREIYYKIKIAKKKDRFYEKEKLKEINDIIETNDILVDIFGKDVTSLITPYVFTTCQNCRQLLKNYKTCNRCGLYFCLECYYDIDFGCQDQCKEHFPWH